MTFRAQAALDADRVFLNEDEYSEEVTYTPSSGSSKTVQAVFHQKASDSGFEVAQISISSDATTGVPDPRNGDRVERADGKEWTVFAVRPLEGMHTLTASYPLSET